MRIIRCQVSSFGNLNNVVFDFNKGLNCIKEDNGYGKSTLTVFIKSMFYGLESTKKSIENNERIKYRPWNSIEKFGGSIDFEWKEKEYKIERFFGKREAEDTAVLTDYTTGKVYQNVFDLGKRLFGIDNEGFLSTTYFAQKDFEIKSNSSITAKYNSLMGQEGVDNSFDLALKAIEEKKKELKKLGDKGLIADKNRELYDVKEQLDNAVRMENQAIQIKEEIEILKGETESLKAQSKILADKISIATKQEVLKEKSKNIVRVKEEREQIVAKKSNLDNVFSSGVPSEEEISLYMGLYNELNNYNVQEKLYLDRISKSNNSQSNSAKNSKKNLFSILTFIGVLMCLLGAGLTILNLVVGLIIIGAGVGLTLICALLWYKNKGQESTEDNEITKLNGQYEELKKVSENAKNKLDRFFEKYSILDDDYILRFTKLSGLVNEYNSLSLQLKKKDVEIENISKDLGEKLDINSLIEPLEDLTVLNSKNQLLQKEYLQKTTALAQKQSALTLANEVIEKVPYLKERVEEIKREILALKNKYEIYSLTIDYLKSADEELKVRYRKPLEDELNKYYKLISNDDMRTVMVDVDLKVTVNDSLGAKDTAYYSKGYKNLFEICKRFALTSVLYKEEKPFIILDDPFSNLDDTKLNEALSLVKELASEYQIIYMVCHESRSV